MKLIERVRLPEIIVPYILKRAFPSAFHVSTSDDQVSFGEDYLEIHEARRALDWLVDQMGGTVQWDLTKKDKKK